MKVRGEEHWTPGRIGDWRGHLERCSGCRRAWQRWQELDVLLRQPPEAQSPPPGLMAQIRARLWLQARSRQQQLRWWWKRYLALLMALAIPWGYLTLWLYPQAARSFLVRLMLWRWWLVTLWEVLRAGFFSPWLWILLSLLAWALVVALTWLWWRWMRHWWRIASGYARR